MAIDGLKHCGSMNRGIRLAERWKNLNGCSDSRSIGSDSQDLRNGTHPVDRSENHADLPDDVSIG